MKICLAQISSISGNRSQNLQNHLQVIRRAAKWESDLVVFPELSITGYEPELAEHLATQTNDTFFDPLQAAADQYSISIAVGMPIKEGEKILIGMLIFQADTPRKMYAKQILHEDEQPYFIAGKEQIFINKDKYKIALGICYETLQPRHFNHAKKCGATVYLASVAKSRKGIERAFKHFALTARENTIPVLLVNSVGPCDDFTAAGQTAYWNEKGICVDQLDAQRPGLLLVDLEKRMTRKEIF